MRRRGPVLRPPGEDWLFHRPDGTPVEATGRPLDGSAESLVERSTRARLRIDRSTLTPDWYGDRLDPEPILDARTGSAHPWPGRSASRQSAPMPV
ncbi:MULTISPECIES: hypothetical protein [Pseudonocardia]|uniref:hypothetical protein n=1 Tax=Pseudonocardia TaxID=1847 RepID=UPI001AD78024|nr:MULTISPECIES: hypothetical protein [Pseudonocardia]